MSKIMLKKLQEIKELSQKLMIINDTIESYIIILNDIKKEFPALNVKTMKPSSIHSDPTLYTYCDLSIILNIDNRTYEFSFFGGAFTQFDTIYINTLKPEIKYFIDQIKNKINFQDLQKQLYSSLGLYANIEILYKKIDFLNNDFTKNSDLIIDYFKTLVKKQVKENKENIKYGYIKFKKDNKQQMLDISYKDNADPLCIQVIFPDPEEMLKLLNNNPLNSKLTYETIFRDEMFRLNQDIFEKLDISQKRIHFYLDIKKNQKYTEFNYTDFKYLFYFQSYRKENINNLAEKIKLYKEIVNF